jgi:hypothetical protein
MRLIVLAALLAAGCSKEPSLCEYSELLSVNELEDSALTIATVRDHNERLKKACPGIQPKFTRYRPGKDGLERVPD